MLKKYYSIFILSSGLLFGQTNDLDKNLILNNPQSIEETNSKAIIRVNLIEDYIQEYFTKTYYNTNGYITEKEFFNDNSELAYKEIYTYNSNNKLEKIIGTNHNQTITTTKTFSYFDGGFKELIKENDIEIKEITFLTNSINKIIAEEEVTLLNNNLSVNKTHLYENEKLYQTDIKYGKDGFIIKYKYNDNNLPVEEIMYDLKNSLLSKKLRKFDEHNNIIEENLFDNNGKLKTNNRIKYKYDDKGNWITRTQYANKFEQPISNTVRTIKY